MMMKREEADFLNFKLNSESWLHGSFNQVQVQLKFKLTVGNIINQELEKGVSASHHRLPVVNVYFLLMSPPDF